MEDYEQRGPGRPRRLGGRREPHTHRYDPATYDAAAEIAARNGDKLAEDVLEPALKRYVKRHSTAKVNFSDPA